MHPAKAALNYEEQGSGFYIAQFKTVDLSLFTYYFESDKQAILIDPTIDISVYQQLSKKRQSKIIQIWLTHCHEDYLTGNCDQKVPIIVGQYYENSNNNVKVFPQKQGYQFNVGSVNVKIMNTPGHTKQSVCFRIFDKFNKQCCIFTGDTLLLGEVGRTDLQEMRQVGKSKQLMSRQLFHSLKKLKIISEQSKIFPGHFAGSQSGRKINQGNFSVMSKQLANNYALKIQSEEQFVEIVAPLPPLPKSFLNNQKSNREGVNFNKLFQQSKKLLSLQQVKHCLQKQVLLIDVRFTIQGGSIKKSLLFNEKGPMMIWLGIMHSPTCQVIVFCEKGTEDITIQRMIRGGFLNIKGICNFTINEWKQKGGEVYQTKTVKFDAIPDKKNITVLDVRRMTQWKMTGIVQKAKTITLQQLQKRTQQLKGIQNIYVHCRSGWRGRLASSYLSNAGISSKIIAEQFAQFAQNGFTVVPYN